MYDFRRFIKTYTVLIAGDVKYIETLYIYIYIYVYIDIYIYIYIQSLNVFHISGD